MSYHSIDWTIERDGVERDVEVTGYVSVEDNLVEDVHVKGYDLTDKEIDTMSELLMEAAIDVAADAYACEGDYRYDASREE